MKEENKAKKIYKRLTAHFRYVVSRGVPADSVIGVFLIGSQNFEMDTEKSDIDSICLVVPTVKDLCYPSNKHSKDYHLINGEIIKVVPITELPHFIKKGNLSFLQMLFTKHRMLRPQYSDIWKEHIDPNAENLLQANRQLFIKSNLHFAYNHIKEGSTNKKLSLGIMTYAFVAQYEACQNYQQAWKQFRESNLWSVCNRIKRTADDDWTPLYRNEIRKVYADTVSELLADEEWLINNADDEKLKADQNKKLYLTIEKIMLRYFEKDYKNKLFKMLFDNYKEDKVNDTL